MRIDLQLSSGITLMMASHSMDCSSYPTGKIQKGLILIYEGQELCEEGVGFGVPILKHGLRTIFPGEVEILPIGGSFTHGMQARYKINLEEKILKTGSGTILNPSLYYGKNFLAAMIRRLPFFRGSLTYISNLLRSWLTLETTYEATNLSMGLSVTYSIDPETGRIEVQLDRQDYDELGITEVIMMNEQGAHYFDRYEDSDGISASGKEIGIWDQVRATNATFIDLDHQISFSLAQVDGAKLYRGRELIGKRLAWSGFGYSFPPTLQHFRYFITVKQIS